MNQIQVGFPSDLEKHVRKQSADNYQSFAAYIRKLVQEDKRQKDEKNAAA